MTRTVNNQEDLVFVLNEFARKGHPDYREGRCDRILIKCLARYFSQDGVLPPEEKYPSHAYVYHLPDWVDDAWEIIETDEKYKDLREAYTAEIGWPFPTKLSLIEQESGGQASERALTVYSFKKILPLICNEQWLESDIEQYFFAEHNALRLVMRRWIKRVYRNGLKSTVDACRSSGMGGIFGKAKMLSMCSAGRVMFTFSAKGKKGDHRSVTFIGEDGEPRGDRFGIQSCYLPLTEAISLVNEVIKHWPSDPTVQADVFKGDKDVFFA